MGMTNKNSVIRKKESKNKGIKRRNLILQFSLRRIKKEITKTRSW